LEIKKQKSIMTGALVLLLAAPVFFLSILYLFGDNYFDVQKFYCNQNDCYSVQNQDSKITVYFINEEVDFVTRIHSLFLEKVICKEKISTSDITDLKVASYTDNLVTSILVDADGIIRGYYNLNNSDEKERLITEIQILLENKN